MGLIEKVMAVIWRLIIMRWFFTHKEESKSGVTSFEGVDHTQDSLEDW